MVLGEQTGYCLPRGVVQNIQVHAVPNAEHEPAARSEHAQRLTERDALVGEEHRATLISEGTTVGRHYAEPTWEHADGSAVSAKVVSSAR